MAVYKIFPVKDSFISSQYPNNNFGRDEIFDISSDVNSISRALIQFDQEEINSLITKISGSYSSSLKLYLANSSNIPQEYNLEIYAISQSWIMGTGRSGDEPNQQNGVTWNYPNNTSSLWLGGSYINYGISQSYSYQDIKDINQDVTEIINDWNNNIIPNFGFLIKQNNLIESSSQYVSTKFFTSDTHTIYPPELEFYWNDIIYNTSLNKINNNQFKSTITNLKSEFPECGVYNFRIKNRDLYPTRQFQNTSLYLSNKVLPENSYWALKDIKTNEIVIDYNNIGTKIGADNNGNYFTVYMNGLQPERYYQILIKTIINNEIVIINNPSNYFKLVR